MTWTRDLLGGLAQLLADAGAGRWNPTGVYTGNQTVITLGGLPPAPHNAIALAVFGSGPDGDSFTEPDSSVSVQIRFRAGSDPRDVDDLADVAFDALHGLADYRLASGVWVYSAQRSRVAQLGRDSNGRWERADSYDLMCHRPSQHRDS